MPEDRQKKDREESAPIDEKHRQQGNIEYEHTSEDRDRDERAKDEEEGELDRGSHSRIEQVPQAPLQGPSRQEVNESDAPGEIAENMGLNQTFAGDEEDEALPDERDKRGRAA